ncbi:MAG: hypothetical protein QOE23_742 [Pseudonocardiales bacterium]|nr:hypothetical protein [Pseudonocardiales bacterium]
MPTAADLPLCAPARGLLASDRLWVWCPPPFQPLHLRAAAADNAREEAVLSA